MCVCACEREEAPDTLMGLSYIILTESSHFFGQVSTKSPKQGAVGQKVKRGAASHGVEGKRVDSRWEAGHVTHLLFPVGSHGDRAHPAAGWR